MPRQKGHRNGWPFFIALYNARVRVPEDGGDQFFDWSTILFFAIHGT